MTATATSLVLSVYGRQPAADALFCCSLRSPSVPTGPEAERLIRREISAIGVTGCACRVAQEFGDHPETAAPRMRKVLESIDAFGSN